jgi:FMN phosphatase YigB (HAD superfamily)
VPFTQTVLFDFGGTLDADGEPWARRYYNGYRSAGGELDFPAFEPLFRESDEALLTLPDIRSLGYRDTLEAQTRCLLPLLPDGSRIRHDALTDGFHKAALRTVARNRPILERLGRVYSLAIISNFTGNLGPCLEELGLRPLFLVATDSAVVGVEKPDPQIFLSTLEALHMTPARAWMVGDNFEADIRPAARLGIRACWMSPGDRQAGAEPPPHLRVRSLPELERILA